MAKYIKGDKVRIKRSKFWNSRSHFGKEKYFEGEVVNPDKNNKGQIQVSIEHAPPIMLYESDLELNNRGK